MAVTSKELSGAIQTPFLDAISRKGINDDFLARQLWSELHAKTPEVVKFDGTIAEGAKLPRGWKHIISSGGKSILEVTRIDIGTRQRARDSVHKIRGDYAAQEHNVHHLGIREVLDALDGRSTGLPSKRKSDGHGA